jgi:uncharacterized protein (TIGR01777 family)
MKIVVSGGTGFIGRALVQRILDDRHTLVVLSRRAPTVIRQGVMKNVAVVEWDGKSIGPWAGEIDGADAVVNLAGHNIGQRWTPSTKTRILRSRIDATGAIVDAIARATAKPRVLVNMSAVGYYGDVPEGEVTESHPRGHDFLAEVVGRWEDAATGAKAYRVRVVTPRFGIVLERGGGALQKFIPPFKYFVGGPLGSGKQWLPWVHLRDAIEVIVFAIQNPTLTGPVNVAAPETVTMKEFTSALGTAMHRPSWAPVPAFVLKAIFGEMSITVLGGQRVSSRKLIEAGFSFRYPQLSEALAAIFHQTSS